MENKLNLADLERKAFRATFEDGLFDLLITCFTLQFALVPLLGDLGLGDFWSSFVFLPVYLVALIGLKIAKKNITVPRIGLAKYSPARKTKIRKLHFYLSLMLLAGIFAGLFAFEIGAVSGAKWFFPALFSFLILFIFSVAGFYLDFPRLFFYGIFISVLVPVGEVLFWNGKVSHHGYPLVFGIASIIIFSYGIFHLVSFLKNYPIQIGEEAHGEI